MSNSKELILSEIRINDQSLPKSLYFPKESFIYPIFDMIRHSEGIKTDDERKYLTGTVRLTNKEYSLPTEFDFKVYLMLMLYSNLHYSNNKNKKEGFPVRLVFYLSELRENLSLARNGKNNKDIIESLKRLSFTHIITDVKIDKRRFLQTFTLLSGVNIVTEPDSRKLKCIVEFNPNLVFDNGYIIESTQPSISVNSKQLGCLKTSNSKMVYIRLRSQIQAVKKSKRNLFTLTYETLLEKHFIGWKRYKYLSDIKKQLKNTLDELREAKIITGYDIYKHQKRDQHLKLLNEVKKDNIFRVDFFLSELKTKHRLSQKEMVEQTVEKTTIPKNGKILMEAFEQRMKENNEG
jgi:hypothetical protein